MKRLTALFRFSAIAGMMFFSSLVFGQMVTPCSGGCNPISYQDELTISKMNKGGKVKLYYSNGLLKYKETTNGRKTHKTYYTENGEKCKEEYVNNRMGIKKTNFYDVTGRKQLVCKGSVN